ncbi:MAG: DNA repair exonuclease, partial [Pseudomonadota bacterium]
AIAGVSLSIATRTQALGAMAEDPGLHWWLLPGNHDSLRAETLWGEVARAASNIHALLEPTPVRLAEDVTLLPAPVRMRQGHGDPTGWFHSGSGLTIGLAHGSVRRFGSSDTGPVIAPDRAERAGLAYLALGDWHGAQEVGPRAWYAGTPERDGFPQADGAPTRGLCLSVTVTGPETAEVAPVEIGRFDWRAMDLALLPGDDPARRLAERLPNGAARDTLLRIDASGRASAAAHAALAAAAKATAPAFARFELRTDRLAVDLDSADLDELAGPLRPIAEDLAAEAAGEGRDAEIAAAALVRLVAMARALP